MYTSKTQSTSAPGRDGNYKNFTINQVSEQLVTVVPRKSLKLLPPDAPNSISAGAQPQTPLGELTALPSWI